MNVVIRIMNCLSEVKQLATGAVARSVTYTATVTTRAGASLYGVLLRNALEHVSLSGRENGVLVGCPFEPLLAQCSVV